MQQIPMEKSSASARFSLPAAMLERWPHWHICCQHHVWITTDKLFRFNNIEFDEMPCKLDSTENSCSFKKYATPF